ncbi:MAG TPA: PilZ domain-containing protein [Myxococcales bacterium]|nr:PilZ domain-containing protein [Myxococcales bacterium]
MMTQCIEITDSPRLERRRFPRWELDRAARVASDEAGLAARCLDVSAGGALLRLQGRAEIPPRVLVYLFLGSLGDVPAVILARVVSVQGAKLRVAFDPLPAFVARALEAEIQGARSARRPSGTLPN